MNVDGVIEGSALREGERYDHRPNRRRPAATGTCGGRPSTGRARRPGLYREVAREIASQVKVTLTPREAQRMAVKRAVNQKAYELYMLGRHYWNQRTLERYKQAVESFLEALDHDPNYAPAYAALADAYMWLGEQGGMPQREARQASADALKNALALDGTLPDAHVSMGLWKMRFDWDWAGAEREFQRALDLNPGSASAHQMYGRSLSFAGRFEDAERELEKARELDPLSITVNAYLGQVYLHARQYYRADEQLRKTLRIDPNHALTHHNLEAVLAQGRWPEAVQSSTVHCRVGRPELAHLAMGCGYARGAGKRSVKILRSGAGSAEGRARPSTCRLYAALS